jgi:hypothetical protein
MGTSNLKNNNVFKYYIFQKKFKKYLTGKIFEKERKIIKNGYLIPLDWIKEWKRKINYNIISKNLDSLQIESTKLKENQINEIKYTIPKEIKLNEKIISVIFNSYDQNILCSIICKNTDNFKKIEKKFYEKYPEYKNTKNSFISNGKKIDSSKNLDENKIKNSDIITFKLVK